MKEHLKRLTEFKINDGLLRESLIRCKPSEAVKDVNSAILKRFEQIEILRDIKEKLQMKCYRKACENIGVSHFHRLDRTWYCGECAKKIQDFENTQEVPIEIFKEFYVKPVAKSEKV